MLAVRTEPARAACCDTATVLLAVKADAAKAACWDTAIPALAVKAETAAKPPVDAAFAAVGPALKAVIAELPVAKVDAAESDAEVRFVTADAVADDQALPPYIEIVQFVVLAAHDSKWPTAYSPAVKVVAANVNGWMFGPLHPCCKLLKVPEDDDPDAHTTARDALATVAKAVEFENEKIRSVCESDPAPEFVAGKLIPKTRSTSVALIGAPR